ncbi:hypothetical protein BDV12DRAFT_182832 [Aspergillus spectabilis]
MPLEHFNTVSDVWQHGLFKDRVVFCTGGSGSICSAQVRALVLLGADACIVGRNNQNTETVAKDIAMARPGSKVLGIGNVDVRIPDSSQRAIDQCVKELGGIDFLMTVLEIDTQGSFNVTKLALPHLIAAVKKRTSFTTSAPAGRIIYVSATMHYTGAQLQAHVAVAKSGVDALSANVAIEYSPYGITSNVIKRIPLGRAGTVKEIADATVYLFSNAGDYANGVVLPVDGGAWRVAAGNPGGELEYPDFFPSGKPVGTKGAGKQSKKDGSKF